MEWYASIKLADLSEQTDDNLIVTDYLNKFPDEGFRGFEVRYTHSPTIILKWEPSVSECWKKKKVTWKQCEKQTYQVIVLLTGSLR